MFVFIAVSFKTFIIHLRSVFIAWFLSAFPYVTKRLVYVVLVTRPSVRYIYI